MDVDLVETVGVLTIDGRDVDLQNNAWIIGDDDECVVVDAPHDAAAVAAGVRGRRVVAIVCTHAHPDHVAVAPALSALVGGPVLLHPADMPVWRRTHPTVDPGGDLADGQVITVAGTDLHVLHTPGHTPGSSCLHAPALGTVFTGDTLFPGGPGATRDALSDFPTIIASIGERLFSLPAATAVLPGHGARTTVGDERPHLEEWRDRGW